MINYADYEFYIDTYNGSLSSDLFTSLIGRASREIDKNVNREIKEADLTAYPRIKWVACELTDFINGNIDNNYTTITIDGVSKTKKSNSELLINKRSILSGLPQELTRCL